MWLVHFVLPFYLASNMAILHGNDVFSILVHSSTKRYSSFLRKVFVFQKTCCKIQKLKMSYALSVGFKIKPLRQSVFLCQDKTNSNCTVKVAKRSNRSFSVYLMDHLFQTSVLFNRWQRNEQNLITCVNIRKRSEAAKPTFQ